jgi:two-component system LytT family response regulator
VLGSSLPDRGFLQRVIVRSGERLRFVRVDAIERISAQGNYVEVFAEGETHLLRDTLAHLSSQLDPGRFVRVHRGEVIARDAVTEIVPLGHGDCVAVLRGGAGVRVSRRYAGSLKLDR